MHDHTPVTPIQDNKAEVSHLKQKLEIDADLTKFFLGLWDQCENLNSADWLNIKRQMVRARNYFDGKQYGTVNAQCQWVDYPKNPGEVTYQTEEYQAHVQTALMEISKGRTELSFSHVSDSQYGQSVAKIAESRFKTHKRRSFDTIKEQQENLSLLLNGVAARYTYFNKERKERLPIFGESEVPGESIQACAECSAPSEGECKRCGSTELKDVSSPSFSAKRITGYSDEEVGENDWESIDPLGLQFYLHAPTVDKTPFILWKQAILTAVLEDMYPGHAIQEGITSVELNYKNQGEAASPAKSLMGESGNGHEAELGQGWFDVSLYGNKVLTEDCKLSNGKVIPAGSKLKEAFPNGVLVVRNQKKLLDLWPENKNDKWTIAPYVTRPGTMIGAGTSAALSYQITKSDLRNLHMASINNDAFRKEFVDPQYLEPENIPNDPTERAVLHNSPTNVGGKIVGTAIDVLPPTSMSPDSYAMDERLSGEMQMVLGTFSGTQSGMPDIKAVQDTAAGMQMWREMTVGRFFPMLSVRADRLDREQALQFLLNDQKFMTPQQWEKEKGDYDADAVKAFLKCDLRNDLIIEVVPESFIPKTASLKIAQISGYGQYLANVAPLGIAPDSELGAYAAGLFEVPKTVIGNDVHRSMVTATVDSFKKEADTVIQEFGDILSFDLQDPMVMGLAQLVVNEAGYEVSPEMDNHEVAVDAYKDWWITDAGRSASNLLKAAVLYRVEEHKQAVLIKTQNDMQMAMEAQAPMMQAQQDQMAQQQQAEQQGLQAQQEAEAQKMEQDAANKEMELTAKATEKVMDAEERELERSFQREEAEKAHQRAKELEELRVRNNPAKQNN